MSMPETPDPGLMAWLADKAWAACGAVIAFVWRSNEAKHVATREAAATALGKHEEQDAKEFKTLHDEQLIQRGHIAKLFDLLREEGQRAEQRHTELLTRAHDGHRELLMALNSKADK